MGVFCFRKNSELKDGVKIDSIRFMQRPYQIIAVAIFALLVGAAYFSSNKDKSSEMKTQFASGALAAKFDYLSRNGNSSCSATFRDFIFSMPEGDRIRGSCCSPMSMHRYGEQVEGLKKYGNIPEVPPDPYDIEAGLAKKLMGYYDLELTQAEQRAYDYAMENSREKGPCCCKCWRWYVYGGLGKLLIRQYGFTGEQLTEVWNLSDGCGGDSEHNH